MLFILDIFLSPQVHVMHMKIGFFENLIYFIKSLKKILWEFSDEYNQQEKNGINITQQLF